MPELPTDIQKIVLGRVPLILTLGKVFLTHAPKSPLLTPIWEAMMLLSHFRQNDRRILCALHTDPQNNEFLHAFSRFHIHQSKARNGVFWIGGLTQEPKSLSDELLLNTPPLGHCMNEIYQHYNELLLG